MDLPSSLTILLMDYEDVPISAKENMTPKYPRKHNTADLLKWPILALLEPEFLKTIVMAFVHDYQALLVTKYDKVYSMGFSAGDEDHFDPKEVPNLRQKSIKSFCVLDKDKIMALGKDGKMYYSECDWFGVFEICCGGRYNVPVQVHDIACNKKQIFALFENNTVCVWKKEYLYLSPSQKTDLCIHNSKKVVCIEATGNSCVALMIDGTVQRWDSKSKIALCFKKIEMPDGVNKIEKIACGYRHTLALSDAGHVYTWDDDLDNQLDTSLWVIQPQKVPGLGLERIVDIASTNYSKIRVVATVYGKIFMWGDCSFVSSEKPFTVPYTSFHEIFAKFSPQYMHRPLFIDAHHESNIVIDSLALAFDDQNSSDFTIIVEGKPIHVHKTILKITSGYFRSMFETNLTENNTNVLEHEEFSYVVYKAFLKYLYTGKIDLPLRDALELLLLAHVYLDNQLQCLCEETVINEISISNVLHVLVIARRGSIKNLMEVSMDFILKHINDVVKSEDFSSLDGEIAKELLQEAAKKEVFKKDI